jgi:predicted RNase H-like nuclease
VEARYVGMNIRVTNFGVVLGKKDVGYIIVCDLETNIHEFAHRLQGALPGLQALFKELHARRTAGDALVSLQKLEPLKKYKKGELTRKDQYIDAY